MASVGVDYVRSPVSGSTALAAQGHLTAVLSGPPKAIERLSDFYQAFTRKTFVVDEAEEARYLKLVLNTLVSATSALLAEALALGHKGGLSAAVTMDVIGKRWMKEPPYNIDRSGAHDCRAGIGADLPRAGLDITIEQWRLTSRPCGRTSFGSSRRTIRSSRPFARSIYAKSHPCAKPATSSS
jgi:hypothetical protein